LQNNHSDCGLFAISMMKYLYDNGNPEDMKSKCQLISRQDILDTLLQEGEEVKSQIGKWFK
jgi:Ulp1 family protease